MNGMIMWSPGVTLEEMEKQIILKAYSFYQNNKTTTANALGIAINTLVSKLEKYEAHESKRKAAEIEHKKRNDDFLHRQRGISQSVVAPAGIQSGSLTPQSSAGIRLEPAHKASTERPVPMPERKEVQAVLPQASSASGSKGRR